MGILAVLKGLPRVFPHELRVMIKEKDQWCLINSFHQKPGMELKLLAPSTDTCLYLPMGNIEINELDAI